MNAVVQPQKRDEPQADRGMPDRLALEQIVARTSEGVLLIDARAPKRPVVYANPAFEAMTGYACDEVVGNPWQPLARSGDSIAALRGAVERSEAVDVDFDDLRKDGSTWTSHISFVPLQDSRGELRYFLVLQREAAPASAEGRGEAQSPSGDQGRIRQKLDALNRTDAVTGLLRHEYFIDILNRDVAVARRDRRPVAVMVFDIIELDAYRATFGAKAADSCVRMIAAQISGLLRRAGDLCARLGDTSLAASVLGQEVAEAELLIEKVVANVRGLKLHNPRAKSGRYLCLSAGVAGGVPGPSDDAERLLARARADQRDRAQAAGPGAEDDAGSGS